MDTHHPKFIPTRDHIDCRARGGSDCESNIARACWLCNQQKGDKDIVAWFFELQEAGDPRAEHVAKFIKARRPVKEEEAA